MQFLCLQCKYFRCKHEADQGARSNGQGRGESSFIQPTAKRQLKSCITAAHMRQREGYEDKRENAAHRCCSRGAFRILYIEVSQYRQSTIQFVCQFVSQLVSQLVIHFCEFSIPFRVHWICADFFSLAAFMHMKIALKKYIWNKIYAASQESNSQLCVCVCVPVSVCLSACVCVNRMRINVLIFDLIAFSARTCS